MPPSATTTETQTAAEAGAVDIPTSPVRPRASQALKSYSAANGNIAPAPLRDRGIYTATSRTAELASEDSDSGTGHTDGLQDSSKGNDSDVLGSGRKRSGSTTSTRSRAKAKVSAKMTKLSKLFAPSSSRSKYKSPETAEDKHRPYISSDTGRKVQAKEVGPATGNVSEDSEEEDVPSEDERRKSLENMRKLREKQRQNVQSMDEAQAAGLQRAKEAPEKGQGQEEGGEEDGSDQQHRGRAASSASATLSQRRARSLSPGQGARSSFLPSKLPNLPLPDFQLPEAITQKLTLPQFQIPIKDFPLQGSGKDSEFDQAHPLWAKQPYKYLYYAYFGLSVGFYHLPAWSLTNTVKSRRGRQDWSWKRATMVKLFRHGTKLTFRTHTNLGRDLTKEVPHSKTVKSKFVWVDKLDDSMISGELARAMKIQKIKALRTCGFWYGESGDGGVGQKAAAGEKVIFHLHGGAYWIGTAHESDVTAAVNTQALRYMHEIYESRKYSDDDFGATASRTSERSRPNGRVDDNENSEAQGDAFTASGSGDIAPGHSSPSSESRPSSSASSSGSKTAKAGPKVSTADYNDPDYRSNKLLRTFSLDYRLCVPGKPQAGSYPAALLDALAGYKYLIEDCSFAPENVVVAGDSAGGNLAIALCRYLRDEKVMPMPGSMLLMSPWADCSRSHSGPTGAPNKMSSAYKNIKSDIISPCLAFRNTAVSAFLGDLPARETYRNPYLSSISLQLPPHKGGKGPFWGFEGFPKRIYITTGSAEISYDQHLTLAHRMAAGTQRGAPVYAGDKLSKGEDPGRLAGRYDYPRPKGLKISLSSATTPGSTPGSEVHAATPQQQQQQDDERRAAAEILSGCSEDSDGQPEASIEQLNSSAGEIMERSHSNTSSTAAAGEGRTTRQDGAGAGPGSEDPTANDPSRADAATANKVDEVMLPSQRQQQMEEKELKQDLREATNNIGSPIAEGSEAERSRAQQQRKKEQMAKDEADAEGRDAMDVELARDRDRQAEELVKVRRGQEPYSLHDPAGRMTKEAAQKRRHAADQDSEGDSRQHKNQERDVIKAQDFIGEQKDGDNTVVDGDSAPQPPPEIRVSSPESDSPQKSKGQAEGSYFDLRSPAVRPQSRRAYSEDSPLTPWTSDSLCPDEDAIDGGGISAPTTPNGLFPAPSPGESSIWSPKSDVSPSASSLGSGNGDVGEDDSAQPHHELEPRTVILDEVKDAIHDYLLFSWFEPERSCTWRRIAGWIDEA